MKTKLSKIFGVGLTLFMLVGLLMATVPASPASAAPLEFSPVSTPSADDDVLTADTSLEFLVVAPDGRTMFAYDNVAATSTTNATIAAGDVTWIGVNSTAGFKLGAVFVDGVEFNCTGIVTTNNITVEKKTITTSIAAGSRVASRGVLYCSMNAGLTWRTAGIGAGLEGQDLVAMAISPDYENDTSLVAANATTVFRSIDGGEEFGAVGADDLAADMAAEGSDLITSVATAPHYLGGHAILVGATNTTAGAGGVYRFTTGSLLWTSLQVDDEIDTNYTDRDGDCAVLAVAFSPNHSTDAEIVALVYDFSDGNTYLTTRFAEDNWAAGVVDAKITAHAPTSACIAFPEDYEWSANNQILIGTAGGADTKADAYRVVGAVAGGTTRIYDLDVKGTAVETNVHSITVTGAIATAEADVLVGQKDSTTVMRCSDPTTSTVTWRGSVNSPTGDATTPNTIVAWSPTGDDAYAVTAGTGSAFSKSADGGVNWSQLGLISVSALANVSIAGAAVIDPNTIFILASDTGGWESVYRTVNGGSSWERVWYRDGLNAIYPSPDYATSETLFVTVAGSTRIWKTSNSGDSWIGLSAPTAVTAMGVVDKNTYFTGGVDREVYKSGRWEGASIKGEVANSILVGADGTIFVGTTTGAVLMSTNDGITYSRVGTEGELGATADVWVAIDPTYAATKTIYAASSDPTEGVQRWVVDESAVWKQMDDDGDNLSSSGIAVSADGVLYVSNSVADRGIRRICNPLAPIGVKLGVGSMTNGLPAGVSLSQVSVGSSTAYAIASGWPAGTYGYTTRLVTFSDLLSVAPAISSPKDKTVTPGTTVTFSWKEIESPIELWYKLQVATDADFANVQDFLTVGTSISVPNLIRGTEYWWRVIVSPVDDEGNPYTGGLVSKKSAEWQFAPKLAAPELKSPAYGADDVMPRPTFSWISVPKATSYELEVADNPFFAKADVKKPLTHTTWTWDKDLAYGTEYYWRVKAVRSGKGMLTNESDWSEAVFTVITEEELAGLAPPPPAPPPQVTVQPAPVPPAPAPQVVVQPAIPPTVLWAIIIIGAVLVIAVIVLIVRTRRVP